MMRVRLRGGGCGASNQHGNGLDAPERRYAPTPLSPRLAVSEATSTAPSFDKACFDGAAAANKYAPYVRDSTKLAQLQRGLARVRAGIDMRFAPDGADDAQYLLNALRELLLAAKELVPKPTAFAAAALTLDATGEVLLTLAAADSARGAKQASKMRDETRKELELLIKGVREALSSKRLRKAALPRSVLALRVSTLELGVAALPGLCRESSPQPLPRLGSLTAVCPSLWQTLMSCARRRLRA